MSKDDSIILDGAGARDGIEERCSLLRESIARVKSDYEKEKLEERLAKLHSGVAVIKVLCVVCFATDFFSAHTRLAGCVSWGDTGLGSRCVFSH